MKLCTECGADLSATAKFCTNCGLAQEEKEATVQTETSHNERVEQPTVVAQSATAEGDGEVVQVGLEDSLNLLVDYGYFFKDTLIRPTSIFTEATGNWLNGLLSVLFLSIVLSLNVPTEFLPTVIRVLLTQVVVVGALFAVNKLFSKNSDTFFDALEIYGGLIQGQIILFALIWLVGGSSEGFTFFLVLVAFLNQLNILNLYLIRVQDASRFKLDKYYQLILANIVFVILIFFMFQMLFA